MFKKPATATQLTLLAAVLASSDVVFSARAQSAPEKAPSLPVPAKPATKALSLCRPAHFVGRVGTCRLIWGVEALSIKLPESGEVIKLTYKGFDQEKAKPLNHKKVEPVLLAAQAGVKLVVPVTIT